MVPILRMSKKLHKPVFPIRNQSYEQAAVQTILVNEPLNGDDDGSDPTMMVIPIILVIAAAIYIIRRRKKAAIEAS